jgi:dTMP kinase
MSHGCFCVIDGIDGCGKSTQAKLLAAHLSQHLQVPVHQFRDPGTTAAGEAIREILLHKKEIDLCPAAQVALFLAARAQVWHDCIRPALERGEVVICDRWSSSTVAYQVYGEMFETKLTNLTRDELALKVWRMSNMLSGRPDFTLILDLDPEAAIQRVESNDRYESKGLPYATALRHGYQQYTELEEASGMLKIDVLDTPLHVFAEIRRYLGSAPIWCRPEVRDALAKPFDPAASCQAAGLQPEP